MRGGQEKSKQHHVPRVPLKIRSNRISIASTQISSHEAAPRTGYAAVAQDRGSSEPCWDFKGASAQASPRKEGGTPWQGPDTALAVASSMQVHLNPRPSGVPDPRDSEPTLAAPPLHDPAALRTLSMERLWLQNLLVVKQCLRVFLAVVALELKGSVPELLLHATEETAANFQNLHIEICREGRV